ncbi:MAG: FtsX-like permease family protein [Gemmatimonadetes bacterium]|uniref:FtsX-like permease family protein n=1 Tax=Candidatus Kutchimonas denitrificans TaxID=3056748 RepID=A0AAE4ZBB2_9BACT|nr:FtsX-like permease family protein [Gemmatimonadota bacterium]NIR75726.1 FtsX-like permease family protein [Candidatus Kutchimonas denitrificans]NIS00339.1 FtsX-like permease family protein [Gemmatimonadota bacterium]NIT65998.1 FtsX-like permease family protein [Gemmatimonadota bacterium]NIU53702.1 FtsX-like permease family protein [Gemmatimonadota bacterium]
MKRRRLFRWPFRDRARIREDVETEVEHHLEVAARVLERGGLEREAARREARRRFGDVKRAKEELEAMDQRNERWARRQAWWGDLWRDLRHGARVLRRRPGFAGLAVGTLALGIGGTAAIFSIVWGLMLRPLPYGEEERLVAFWRPGHWSPAEFEVAREAGESFSALAAWSWDARTLRRGEGVARLESGVIATGNLFELLAAPPEMGSGLRWEDSRPGGEPGVVLSDGLWRDEFGGDPAVLGTTIRMSGEPRLVVGVMPPAFYFPTPEARYWIPLTLDRAESGYSGNHWLRIAGRMAPGVSTSDPGALAPIVAALGERFDYPPDWDKTRDASFEPLRQRLLGDQRPALFLLLGVVGVVLLMACANVAALLLGRTADRRSELAVRAAMGASRGRLARQLVSESVLMGLLAGALGAGLAAAGFRALVARLPLDPALVETLGVDWPLLAGALGLALAAGTLIGAAPLVGVIRGGLRGSLGGRRASGGGLTRGRLQSALVVTQVALAVILVAGASMLTRSLARMRAVDVGFEPERVLAVDAFAAGGDLDQDERRRFFPEAAERLGELPGVISSAAINRLPVRDGGYTSIAEPAERELGDAAPTVWWRVVTPDYHRTMGIRLLRGRGLSERDRSGAPHVAVINETAARALWPDGDAIGKRYTHGIDVEDEITVVGVVEDVRLAGPREPPVPVAYRPYDQASFVTSQGVMVIKTGGAVGPLAGQARALIQRLNPAVAVPRMASLESILRDSMADTSRIATFVALFAALALALGAIGVYGVVSYGVVRRRQEFGVRLALGSSPERLLRSVLGRGLILASAGLALGLAGLAALAGLVRPFVHDIAPLDPLSLAAAAAILTATAALASWLPARRAATVDPVNALRAE